MRFTILLLFCLFTPDLFAQAPVAGTEYIRLKTEYDRFQDETTIATEDFWVWQGAPYERLAMTVLGTNKGTNPKPVYMGLGYMLIFKDRRPFDRDQGFVIADGERINLGALVQSGPFENIVASVYKQLVMALVPFEVFGKSQLPTRWKCALGQWNSV